MHRLRLQVPSGIARQPVVTRMITAVSACGVKAVTVSDNGQGTLLVEYVASGPANNTPLQHTLVLQTAVTTLESVGIDVVGSAVSEVVSYTLVGTLIGSAGGTLIGSTTKSFWTGLAIAATGTLAGSLVKKELLYAIGRKHAGRWVLVQPPAGMSPGTRPATM